MIVIVNGKSCETDSEKSLQEFLEEISFGKKSSRFAVTINRKAIPFSHWEKEIVREGDHVEFIYSL